MGILVDGRASVFNAASFLKLSGRVAGAPDELFAEILVAEPYALSYGLRFEPNGVSWTGEEVHALFEPGILGCSGGFGMRR